MVWWGNGVADAHCGVPHCGAICGSAHHSGSSLVRFHLVKSLSRASTALCSKVMLCACKAPKPNTASGARLVCTTCSHGACYTSNYGAIRALKRSCLVW